MTDQYYSRGELERFNFAALGENVLIHRTCNILRPSSVSIGRDVRIDGFSIISVSAALTIGSYIHVGAFAYIAGAADVVLEDFANLSQSVRIYSSSDDYSGNTMSNPMISDAFKGVDTRPVRIGRHVIVGSGSVVLPGVDIGDGCSVGALSMVRDPLEPWGIYAGVPARRIKARSRRLLELEARFLKEKGMAN